MLPSLRNLESLELPAPALTSAADPALARQPKLTRQHLSGTTLTDEAVPVLGSIKMLKELDLSGLFISAASLEKLKRSLPACNIVR